MSTYNNYGYAIARCAIDKLAAFIGRIVRNQWRSKTSDFYRKYRRNEQTSYTPEVWNIADED